MNRKKQWIIIILLMMVLFCLSACQESNESKYNRANKLMTEGKYEESVKLFDEISTYEDSSKMAIYGKAIAAAESGDYKKAFSSFNALGDFKDCSMMITYYTARQYESQATDTNWTPRLQAAETYDTVALFLDSTDRAENCRKTVYDKAVAYAATKQYAQSMEMLAALHDYEDSELLRRYYEAFDLEKNDKFTEASRSFMALGDYRDSAEQAVEVLKRGYQAADALEKSGDHEAAYEIWIGLGEYSDSFARANKSQYDLGVTLREEKKWDEAREAFAKAGNYSDAVEQIKETKYQQAKAFMTDGDYSGAYQILLTLKEYKDVGELLKNDDNLTAVAAAREAKLAPYRTPGNMVRFGRYEQDNNTSNGPEEIDWIVLDYDEVNHKALLLSRYGLEAMPYNTEETDTTWEKCTMRMWLNGEFLNKAFSAAEQSVILTTAVDNSKSQGYSEWNTDGGNNTEDRIFLLSYAEVNRYLDVTYDDNMKSRVTPTAYARAHGAVISGFDKTEDGAAAGFWWLRSPGLLQDLAANVHSYGSLDFHDVHNDNVVVRPAFWVNLESDIF